MGPLLFPFVCPLVNYQAAQQGPKSRLEPRGLTKEPKATPDSTSLNFRLHGQTHVRFSVTHTHRGVRPKTHSGCPATQADCSQVGLGKTGLPGWSMQWLPILWTWIFCFVLFVFVLSIGSPVTQAGLGLVMKLKMTSNS